MIPFNPSAVLGVVGGAGVAAAIEFLSRFEQHVTESGAFRDQHHPQVILHQATQAPSRSMYLEGRGPSFIPSYQGVLSNLRRSGATLACITCNTAHAYIEQLRQGIDLEIVNMIEETANYVTSLPQPGAVGIICSDGSLQCDLYGRYFSENKVLYPDADVQREVTAAIVGVKKGLHRTMDDNDTSKPQNLILNAVDHLEKKGAGTIIIGCTDISLIYKPTGMEPVNIVDSMDVLMRVVISKMRIQERNV